MRFDTNHLVFFDIESTGQHKDVHHLKEDERLYGAWSKYLDVFRKRFGEDKDEEQLYKESCGLYPEFGKVVCVSVGFITNNGDYRLQSFYQEDEKELLFELRELFNKIHKQGFKISGHNIKNFDIPFLGKRYLINGMEPPKIFPTFETKPWEVMALDTSDMWKFASNMGFSSLDLITTVMGIESPKDGDVHGKVVHDHYWAGNLEGIAEYCEKDVRALMDLIIKLQNLE